MVDDKDYWNSKVAKTLHSLYVFLLENIDGVIH